MSRPASHEPRTQRWLLRRFCGVNLAIGYALLATSIILAGWTLVRGVLGV